MSSLHKSATRGVDKRNLDNTIGSVIVRDCIHKTNGRYTVGERKRSSSKVSSRKREFTTMHEDFHVLWKKDPFVDFREDGPPRDWGEEIEVEVDVQET